MTTEPLPPERPRGRPPTVAELDEVARAVARLPPEALAAKRVFDTLVAGVGLVATTPLLVSLGVLVIVDSPGSALYFQERTGLGQVPFTLVKLRTMDDRGRVTRVGRFLRPAGLDEIPQLWNVLVGDMSLIGPRPEIPHLVDKYESELPGYRARHLLRPGITGWAQVHGLRGECSIAERLRHDLEYLRGWSLRRDALVLAKTVSTVWNDTRRALGRRPPR